jgi:polyribonucleotide nucleotidyltransferase
VYVNIILYSADGVDMPDAWPVWRFGSFGRIGYSVQRSYLEVRVARINGEYVINPTFEQLESADMDIMVGATYENIMMVEGEMSEVSEQDLLGALKPVTTPSRACARLR